MKKGIIAWLTLCALMLSVLCSCTNDTTEKSSQSEDNSATSTASADTSADDE